MCIHPQPFNESDEDAMPSLAVTTAIPTPKSNAVPLRLWIGLAMKKQSVSVWFSVESGGRPARTLAN